MILLQMLTSKLLNLHVKFMKSMSLERFRVLSRGVVLYFLRAHRLLQHRLLTLGVLVTERLCSHVAQPDGSLTAAVHKLVAVDWMEFCCRNYLCQFLHVGRLDINYV